MPPGDEFENHLSRWVTEEMEEAPVSATQLGIPGYDDRLGDHSADAFRRRAGRNRDWLAALGRIDREQLTFDQQMDLDLLRSTLLGRQVFMDWEAWQRDPSLYLNPCLYGVFYLFLHRLHSESDLVAAAAARLRAVPGVLADARSNLSEELASEIIAGRGASQCAAGATYARQLLPAEVNDARLRSELAEAGEVAAAAFDETGRWLADLAGRAKGSYALGEERYSALLRHRELLGYGAAELQERGRHAYEQLDAEMIAVAERVDRDACREGGWRAVVERLNATHPDSPDTMRSAYEEATSRARTFLSEHGLVTLPEGEHCYVDPSPHFQRPIMAVASYSAPPPFQPGRVGHFFVPYPPDGTTEAEIQQRLATNSFATIPTVSVHEAYPGHHWHLSWMKDRARPLRKILRTPYFVEGWALYAEQVMREHGFFEDPATELCHLDARIFRAARIVVDTSLHAGEMTFEEAVQHMRTRASLTEPTARAEVGRYCSWPTQASAYLTGALEIERIRTGYLAAGRGSLREFHDTIAGSGGMPIALAERAVTGP